MTEIVCTRRIQFAYGHRVYKHEGKCAFMHGHNGVAFVTAKAPVLDEIGRVIDFGVLKERIGGWIDRHWDHGFLFSEEDSEMDGLLRKVQGQKFYALPYNPTAENMAKYLLEIVGPDTLKDTDVELVEVVIWETENCWARATI